MQTTLDYTIFRSTPRKLRQEILKEIRAQYVPEEYPVIVSRDMEILDGRHRLEVAQELKQPVCYLFQEEVYKELIIVKGDSIWRLLEYINYYSHAKYSEYQALFMEYIYCSQKDLLEDYICRSTELEEKFKCGKYRHQAFTEDLKLCKDLIDKVWEKSEGLTDLKQRKFTRPFFCLVTHPNFDRNTWERNSIQLFHRFGNHTTSGSFLRMLLEVYNWKAPRKIDMEF